MSGPLQISAGYPWQDVKPGSVLWRLVEGANQRSQVLGGFGFFDVGKLRADRDGARIVPYSEAGGIFPGANLQDLQFWNLLSNLVLSAQIVDDFVNSGWVDPSFASFGNGTTQAVVRLKSAAFPPFTRIVAGDILGAGVINGLLSVLHSKSHFMRAIGSGTSLLYNYFEFSPSDCQTVINRANSAAFVSTGSGSRSCLMWCSAYLFPDSINGAYRMWATTNLSSPVSFNVTNGANVQAESCSVYFTSRQSRAGSSGGEYEYYPVGGIPLNSLSVSGFNRPGSNPQLSIQNDLGIDPLVPTHQILGMSCAEAGYRQFAINGALVTKYNFADLEP